MATSPDFFETYDYFRNRRLLFRPIIVKRDEIYSKPILPSVGQESNLPIIEQSKGIQAHTISGNMIEPFPVATNCPVKSGDQGLQINIISDQVSPSIHVAFFPKCPTCPVREACEQFKKAKESLLLDETNKNNLQRKPISEVTLRNPLLRACRIFGIRMIKTK